jgi:hypothetical protein
MYRRNNNEKYIWLYVQGGWSLFSQALLDNYLIYDIFCKQSRPRQVYIVDIEYLAPSGAAYSGSTLFKKALNRQGCKRNGLIPQIWQYQMT